MIPAPYHAMHEMGNQEGGYPEHSRLMHHRPRSFPLFFSSRAPAEILSIYISLAPTPRIDYIFCMMIKREQAPHEGMFLKIFKDLDSFKDLL